MSSGRCRTCTVRSTSRPWNSGPHHAPRTREPAHPGSSTPSTTSDGKPCRSPPRSRRPTRAWSDGVHVPRGLEAVEDHAYRRRTLADGRGGAFDRPAANVPDSEDPRPAGLEEQRRSALVLTPDWGDIGPREQEAGGVLGELAREPPGSGAGADEDEQPADLQVRRLESTVAADPHALQPISPDQPDDLGARPDRDAGVALDPVDEVAR